ncbi:MAG: hypothetical protein PHC41_11180 [Lachnospiraceae bacterium]|nr:hypothetical protein [Lachnospiraceae bacterium]MDD3616770.1 hypothetical protein [Lachnospiraceae bacterium]
MEKRYESDLTPKEKRQQEKEKIKGLRGKQRLIYLWTYYKFVLLIVVAVIAAISVGVTMYRNARMNTVLSIAVFDANSESEESFEQLSDSLLKVMDPEEKYDQVAIDSSGVSAEDQVGLAKAMVIMNYTSEVDVVICNEDFYQRYEKEGAFLDWKDVLGDSYGEYEEYMTDGVIDLSKSDIWMQGNYTEYAPVYMCVRATTENQDNIIHMLDYMVK